MKRQKKIAVRQRTNVKDTQAGRRVGGRATGDAPADTSMRSRGHDSDSDDTAAIKVRLSYSVCWWYVSDNVLVQKEKRKAVAKTKVGFRFYDAVDTKNRNRERKKTKKLPKTDRLKLAKARKHKDRD